MSLARILSRLYRGGLRATSQTVSCSLKQERSITSVCQPVTTQIPSSFNKSSVLRPVLPDLTQCSVRTYKVKSVLKLRCSGCYFVQKFDRLYVECSLKPRHKQMQIKPGTSLYRDDYSKGKWKRSIHWQWRQREGFYQKGNTEYARVDWLKGRIGTHV